MRKSLTYKILAAVLTLSAANWAVPANVLAGEVDTDGKYIVTDDGETISDSYNGVYGNGHSFTINGGTIDGDVFGVGDESYTGDASGGNVTINGNATVTGNVFGGNSSFGDSANDNTVNISGGSVTGDVYGGNSSFGDSANDNEIIISGSADIENANLYGSYSASGTGNTLTIDGWSSKTNTVQNFNDIAFKNINWNENKPVLTITAGDLTNTKLIPFTLQAEAILTLANQ